MDWHAHIDAYCERTDAAFWSEPINAFSNIAFLIAGLAAIWLWRRRGADDIPALILIALILIIGLGSFLFHTFANRWSLLADVIPITVFIYTFFFIAMRRFFGFGVLAALGLVIAFFAASVGIDRALPPGTLHGSGSYLPAFFALVAVGLVLRSYLHPAASGLLIAAGVFALSLTFRTLDQPLCDFIPLGTHFLWHGLNGLLLFVLVETAMRARAAPPVLKRRSGMG